MFLLFLPLARMPAGGAHTPACQSHPIRTRYGKTREGGGMSPK